MVMRNRSRTTVSTWLTAFAVLIPWTTSQAQGIGQEELERCAGVDSPAQRLACFEELTDRGRIKDEPQPIPSGTETPASSAEPAARAADTEIPIPESAAVELPPTEAQASSGAAEPGEEQTIAEVPAAATVKAAGVRDPVEVTPQAEVVPDTASPAGVAATAPTSADTLGAEHLRDPASEEPEQVTAIVTDVTKGRNDVLYFHFANGQIWRQIEPRRWPYPKQGNFEVQVTVGMMGEYRMRIGEKGRMTRIRRVQ